MRRYGSNHLSGVVWGALAFVLVVQSGVVDVAAKNPRQSARPIVTSGGQSGTLQPAALLGPPCPAPDRYEEDDAQAEATDFGLLGNLNVLGLNTDAPGDDDWFAFVPADDGQVVVTIWFHQLGGDLDMSLHDVMGELLAVSNSSNDFETIEWSMAGGETYAVRVYTNTGACNGYGLVIDGPDYLPDHLEQNDTFATATGLGTIGDVLVQDLTIHTTDDEDWFSFIPCTGGEVVMTIAFLHAVGDLNMSIHDSAGSLLASSVSTTDHESIVYSLTAGDLYLLQVYGQFGDRSAYQLTLDSPDPTIDCNNNNLDDSCEVYGDLDGDGDVDLSDYVMFCDILTGPGGIASCRTFDFDADGDIDLADWSAFQTHFIPPAKRR